MLREFSNIVKITDSAGRPVQLSHTHRFRHTKLTRLAELGLPVHVLQRYAGHCTPTMSMHYVARRDEHAEQAFLATRKFKADGTRVALSQEDHDALHLLDRADRFLPHAEPGLGVGLTLGRILVELHGGSVSAHSDGAGTGSEFVVRLPSA